MSKNINVYYTNKNLRPSYSSWYIDVAEAATLLINAHYTCNIRVMSVNVLFV